MPRRKRITPRSVEAQVEAEIESELDELVSAIAAEEGPAIGSEYISADREVQMWGVMDPRVDYETLKHQLMTGQVPPDLIDPQNDGSLALVRGNPEWAQFFAAVTPEQPLDEHMADLVATTAEYPMRQAVYGALKHNPRAQVEKSNRTNERWMRQTGQREPVRPVAPPAPAEPMYPEAQVAPPVEPAPPTSAPPMPPMPGPETVGRY
jgi:hypothetical protein